MSDSELFLQAFWSQVMNEGQLANINELHLKNNKEHAETNKL